MDLRAIGTVSSPLTDRAQAPKQADEDAPEAVIALDAEVAPALEGLSPGDEVMVLTWLHEAPRDVLTVHPRGDASRPLTGVFATRAPVRPNPIGLHRVRITAIAGTRLTVDGLEAIDGTPVVDIKSVLDSDPADR